MVDRKQESKNMIRINRRRKRIVATSRIRALLGKAAQC